MVTGSTPHIIVITLYQYTTQLENFFATSLVEKKDSTIGFNSYEKLPQLLKNNYGK